MYVVHFCDANGVRRLQLTDQQFQSLRYSGSVNAATDMEIVFDRNLLRGKAIAPDGWLEIWRDDALEMDAVWLIDRIQVTGTQARTLTVSASRGIALLDWRIVAYDSTAAASAKSGAADTVMTAYVHENLSTSATDTTRRISTTYLTVATSPGLGATVAIEANRGTVLGVCQDAAQSSAKLGTSVYFDIVLDNPNGTSRALKFRTFRGQRGILRNLTISTDNNTMRDPVLEYDYSRERNYAYVRGSGEGSLAPVTAVSTPGSARGALSRKEILVDGSQATTSAQRITMGEAELQSRRPRVALTGRVNQTPFFLYGKHWKWGDRMGASFDGVSLSVQVETVAVSVEGGKEDVAASIRGEA